MNNIKRKLIAIIVFALSIVCININAYATTGKTTESTTRLRKEASTDSSTLALISQDEEVEVLEEVDSWYKATYKGKTGYIRKDMLQVSGEVTSITNQNVVEEPNEQTENTEQNAGENQTISEVNNEQTITSSENNQNVEQNDENNVNFHNELTEGTKTKICREADVRMVPLINSTVISNVEQGTEVTVKEIINKWVYIYTDTQSGWVSKNSFEITQSTNTSVDTTQISSQEEPDKETSEDTNTVANNAVVDNSNTVANNDTTQNTNTTSTENSNSTNTNKVSNELTTKIGYVNVTTVNLRKEASKTSTILASLSTNTEVEILEESGGWSKVTVKGKTGYIATQYLSDEKVTVTSRSEESRNTDVTSNQEINTEENKKTESTTSGDDVVAYAKKFLGCKYVYGGTSPTSGFDCSGYVQYVYKNFGITLSRSSTTQAKEGVAVEKSDLKNGDIIIFRGTSNKSIGHVGIYVGGNTFIHAANPSKGVITTSLSDSYYSARYCGARRII